VLPYWWHALDYVFLIIGFVAVFHASAHAPAKVVKLSLWLFLACLAVAVIFEEQLHWMAYVASAGLVATHFINIRQHKKKI
jgi:drug/metabolite transporter (DMT)-like permease